MKPEILGKVSKPTTRKGMHYATLNNSCGLTSRSSKATLTDLLPLVSCTVVSGDSITPIGPQKTPQSTASVCNLQTVTCNTWFIIGGFKVQVVWLRLLDSLEDEICRRVCQGDMLQNQCRYVSQCQRTVYSKCTICRECNISYKSNLSDKEVDRFMSRCVFYIWQPVTSWASSVRRCAH